MAATIDWLTLKLARECTSETTSRWVLAAQLTNWFNFFCLCRTFSNCLETLLTTAALFLWVRNWRLGRAATAMRLPLILAAAACAIRPPAAVMWVAFVLQPTFRHVLAVREAIGCVLAVVALNAILDSACYGKVILVQLNFLRFNLLEGPAMMKAFLSCSAHVRPVGCPGGSAIYGTHPAHWYLTQGMPTVLFTMVPFLLIGLKYRATGSVLLYPCMVMLASLSLIPHKEFRFLLPIMPTLMIFVGSGAEHASLLMLKRKSRGSRGSAGFLLLGVVVASQIMIAIYTSCVHQRGVISVMHDLRSRLASLPPSQAMAADAGAVHFLMPCHSTPFYSHLHRNVSLSFLDCSPRFASEGKDEADTFYDDPAAAFALRYRAIRDLPLFLVMFDHLSSVLRPTLDQHYSLCSHHFHTHLALEWRISSYVDIWCLQSQVVALTP